MVPISLRALERLYIISRKSTRGCRLCETADGRGCRSSVPEALVRLLQAELSCWDEAGENT